MIQNRTDSQPKALRGTLLALAALCVASLGGCATTYSSEEEPRVSQSRAKRDLGIDYLSTNRTGMAILQLTASLEMDAEDPQTHLWLGEAYRRKGQTTRAEAFLLDALELAGGRKDSRAAQEARLNLSALLSQMGRYADAVPHCDALAEDPTFSTPWRPLSNCGWALMKLGRLDEARSRFERALGFYSRFGPALMNLGILESKEGHRLAAIKMFEKALASRRLNGSGHAEANYRLGELYVALGARAKAVEHFKQAAKIAPDDDWGSQSQAYLDLLR